MSRVTNAILTAHVGREDSDPEIDSVNKFLRETEGGGGGKFVEASQHAGGPKHMECRVYLSAFNHADTEVILRAVDQAQWRDKDMVQVFVKEQEQEEFLLRFSGRTRKPSVTLELTRDELGIVNNALNEVCNGIQLDGEFDTRMGCTVEEARELLAKLHGLAPGHE
jgi:hypothetical protein